MKRTFAEQSSHSLPVTDMDMHADRIHAKFSDPRQCIPITRLHHIKGAGVLAPFPAAAS
jgi:hypothetical protein